MNYLEWINQCTPTRWWHDSGNPDEIELAIRRGATGVTTNPVLTFRSFQSQPEFWNPKVVALGDDFEPEARAEALLKLVATYAAEKVRPVYERTNGADGYALGQLNPTRAGDAEGMLAQARRVHSWAENIAVKLPATAAGIEVIEHLAEEGIPICATINVSVSQAIAVAEAYARGKQKALAAGVKPPLCIAVQQVGRLDDYLRDVAQDMKLGLDESVITMAGLAVAKRTYQIFEQRGYDAVSVGEIAKAVGIKAPSLYNHFPSKQAIFDAILETTSAHYQKDTAEISVHVQDSQKDIPVFSHISEELLVEKVRQIFLYSLHDKTISQFRRMMTLEQFRSPKFAELLSKRYVDWMISYHAGIFRALVANGELRNEDPDTLAWMYVSPIIVLLSVCDRQPEREAESLAKLDAHVKLFFRTFNIEGGEK